LTFYQKLKKNFVKSFQATKIFSNCRYQLSFAFILKLLFINEISKVSKRKFWNFIDLKGFLFVKQSIKGFQNKFNEKLTNSRISIGTLIIKQVKLAVVGLALLLDTIFCRRPILRKCNFSFISGTNGPIGMN